MKKITKSVTRDGYHHWTFRLPHGSVTISFTHRELGNMARHMFARDLWYMRNRVRKAYK